MNDQIMLIAGAIACVTFVAAFAIWRLLERRLASLPGPEAGATPTLDSFERADRSFSAMVHGTGMGITTGQALGLFTLSAFALTTLLFLWRDEAWSAALGLALGLALPLCILIIMKGRYKSQVQAQLPDAFYYLARSMRAGLSLEQTITQAGEQMDEPLAAEFRHSSAQMMLGLHPQTALANTASRIGLLDFNIFVSTVALYFHSGGNLALMLDRLAASTRDRNQFLGYFQAATALGRIAGVCLGSAVPILIAAYAILQPEHIGEFFQSVAGWQLLAIVAVLELVGIVWLYYLLRLDY